MKNVVLEGRKICKSFASNGVQNHVLDMLDVTIYQGDFTIIMGASGAGKSTLLYALSGMDRLTSGEVTYGGKSMSAMKEKEMAGLRSREFGFIFQQTHLVSNLTLSENILVTGYLGAQKSRSQIKERAASLMERMQIQHAKDRYPSQVSGGEAQRTAIARAIINEPGILFADEPTGALNKKNTEEVLAIMSTLAGEGQSILMVTHDVKAAARGNRIIYLEDGKILDEMHLPDYEESELKSREIQLNAWLTSLSW